MKPFTKQETVVVGAILLALISLSIFNFRISLRRARDAQRRGDLGTIYNALNKFQQDFGFYPPASDDGKIVACKGKNYDKVVQDLENDEELDLNKYFKGLRPCNWGVDGLRDLADEDHVAYLDTFPTDPRAGSGYKYVYFSNFKRFQIFAYLEGLHDEEGYSAKIVERKIDCGGVFCNFGRASGTTPLEKSIKEYENELLERKKE